MHVRGWATASCQELVSVFYALTGIRWTAADGRSREQRHWHNVVFENVCVSEELKCDVGRHLCTSCNIMLYTCPLQPAFICLIFFYFGTSTTIKNEVAASVFKKMFYLQIIYIIHAINFVLTDKLIIWLTILVLCRSLNKLWLTIGQILTLF